MAKAVGDENVFAVQAMMGAMFGEDGIMNFRLVAVDQHHVVYSMGDEEQLLQFIGEVKQKSTGLQDSPNNKITLRLLDPKAPWIALVDPGGYVELLSRMMNQAMAQFGGGAPTIPEYPQSAPIGFSMNVVDGRWEGDMALPVEMLKSLAEYIKTVQKMAF